MEGKGADQDYPAGSPERKAYSKKKNNLQFDNWSYLVIFETGNNYFPSQSISISMETDSKQLQKYLQ